MACPHNQQQFMCPGDPVVDSSGYSGNVVAVNPFQKTVAVNYGGAINSQYPIQTVALGLGCFEGYCVGDSVVDSSGYPGKVSAVNPYNGNIAINYGGTISSLYGLATVALGLGCDQGYCVGDQVVDSSGYAGTLVAINYANDMVAINYGGTISSIYKIQTVSSTQFCATYGDADRSVPRFPVFDASLYISPDFQFSLSRPVQ
jgi:preprotein translocase subunit YajC